jgi:ketosteroid isomerase-like protein
MPSFDDIFTPDAVMNLSIAGSQQTGVADISTYLSGLLTEFKTQHNFGTQKIDISDDGKSAVRYYVFHWHFLGD